MNKGVRHIRGEGVTPMKHTIWSLTEVPSTSIRLDFWRPQGSEDTQKRQQGLLVGPFQIGSQTKTVGKANYKDVMSQMKRARG